MGPVPCLCLRLHATIGGRRRGAPGAKSERAEACSVDSGGGALGARVRQALERERWPFLVPWPAAGIQLSDDVVFSDGLQSLRGREQYLAASEAFQAQFFWKLSFIMTSYSKYARALTGENFSKRQLREEVPDAAVALVRVTQVDHETVSVRYNISWTPPAAAWLEALGAAVPGWRVVKVGLSEQSIP